MENQMSFLECDLLVITVHHMIIVDFCEGCYVLRSLKKKLVFYLAFHCKSEKGCSNPPLMGKYLTNIYHKFESLLIVKPLSHPQP